MPLWPCQQVRHVPELAVLIKAWCWACLTLPMAQAQCRPVACCRPRRSMKRLYDDSESQQQHSSAPVRDSQEDADLMVHPFASTTQSDQPAHGMHRTRFLSMSTPPASWSAKVFLLIGIWIVLVMHASTSKYGVAASWVITHSCSKPCFVSLAASVQQDCCDYCYVEAIMLCRGGST